VLELHAERSAQIDEAVVAAGYDSPWARGIAARNTRDAKRHTPVADLMVRWRGELEGVGYPVAELSASVEEAAARRQETPERGPVRPPP
jgi:hypothetical protein